MLGALLVVAGRVIAGRQGLIIGLVIALGINAFTYFFSDKIALRSMRARPVSEAEQPAMYRDRARAGDHGPPADAPALRVPDRRSPTPSPPAATRGTPRSAVTEGILQMLDRRELRAVLGHELSHVYNRDILISSVAGALAACITYLAQFALFFGGGGDDDRDRNPVGRAADADPRPDRRRVIQLAISRTREYQADASGAELTDDPLALASALRKIEDGTQRLPLPPEPRSRDRRSHLMIANPFRGRGMRQPVLHPPADGRADRPAGADGRVGPRFWR